jgi:hypothetical protein
MKALLAGPSPWLGQSGAVVSAFPPGTQLVADTVPITGTSASVDVSAPALDTSSDTKRRMLRQAAASLAKLRSIFTVQLSIEGVPQDISAQSDDAAESYPQVDPRPLVISNGRFGYLQSTGSLDEIPRVSDAVASFTPWAAAYSGVHRAATVNTEDGLYLVRSSGSTALVDARENLAPGVFDYYGYIWSVPRELPHDLFASTIGGAKRLGEHAVARRWASRLPGAFTRRRARRGSHRVCRRHQALRLGNHAGCPEWPGRGRAAARFARHRGRRDERRVGGRPDGRGACRRNLTPRHCITLNVVGGSARSVSPGAAGLNLASANGIDQFFMRSGDGSLLSYRPGGAWRWGRHRGFCSGAGAIGRRCPHRLGVVCRASRCVCVTNPTPWMLARPRLSTWLQDALALVLPVSCVACGEPDRRLCAACRARARASRFVFWASPSNRARCSRRTGPSFTVASAGPYTGPLVEAVHALKEEHRTGIARDSGSATARECGFPHDIR